MHKHVGGPRRSEARRHEAAAAAASQRALDTDFDSGKGHTLRSVASGKSRQHPSRACRSWPCRVRNTGPRRSPVPPTGSHQLTPSHTTHSARARAPHDPTPPLPQRGPPRARARAHLHVLPRLVSLLVRRERLVTQHRLQLLRHVQHVPRRHDVVVVHRLDERLELAALRELLLAHVTRDLPRVAVDPSNCTRARAVSAAARGRAHTTPTRSRTDAVAELAVASALIVRLYDDCLAARIPPLQNDDHTAGLEAARWRARAPSEAEPHTTAGGSDKCMARQPRRLRRALARPKTKHAHVTRDTRGPAARAPRRRGRAQFAHDGPGDGRSRKSGD